MEPQVNVKEMGGASQPEEAEQLPLLNPVILENLFEVCDTKDLSELRLVSMSWNRASRTSWRSTAIVKLGKPPVLTTRTQTGRRAVSADSPESLGSLTPVVGQLRQLTIREKLAARNQPMASTSVESRPAGEPVVEQLLRAATVDNDAHGLTAKPFTKFWIEKWALGAKPQGSDRDGAFTTPAQIEFWKVCGTWIKTLSLVSCSFDSVETFWNICAKMTPNVVELVIDHPDFDPIWQRLEEDNVPKSADYVNLLVQPNLTTLQVRNLDECDSWPTEWRDICRGFPNLKMLVLSELTSDTLLEVLRDIATARKEGVPISLKELEIKTDGDEPEEEEIADAFPDCQLPLETFYIEFADTESSLVKHLLQQFAASLRTFQCNFYRNAIHGAQPAMTFQTMLGGTFEHLKDLRLNGPVALNFAFFEYTPNLELLHMDYQSGDKSKSLGSEKWLWTQEYNFQSDSGVRLESLIEFKTERIIDNYDAFLNITKWMPNLTRLSAPLTGVTFPIVCIVWKSTLKELHITKDGIIGDEITGLGAARAEEECINGLPPNIADLKELEKFTQDKGSGYFTDLVVLYGFRFLPKLRLLRLFVTNDLSADALAILKKKNIDFSWTKQED